MRGLVRGLSFGYFLAAAAYGGALIEHGLLSSRAAGGAPVRLHRATSHSSVPVRLPLRGSLDMDAPLLLPFEAPAAPRKPPRKSRSSATQVAEMPVLDRSASAG